MGGGYARVIAAGMAPARTRSMGRRRRWVGDPAPRIKHRAYGARHNRGYQLKYCYGMSLTDYDLLFEHQRGACASCKRRSARTLCVDHCHATGKVRGLLCSKCNLGIGHFEDNPILLRAASAYLEASLGASVGGCLSGSLAALLATSAAARPRGVPSRPSRQCSGANRRSAAGYGSDVSPRHRGCA